MPVRLLPGHGQYANSYVVNGVLVDTGATPMAIEAHKNVIKYIIITHRHYDHIVYLAEAVRMTGAEVLIHEIDAPGLTDDIFSLAVNFGAHAPGINPTRFLKEGDVIDNLEVIHTPGHTAGSICLYDPVSKSLISGDTVFGDGGYGRYDLPSGDHEALTLSIERLRDYQVDGVYCGHGAPARDKGNIVINKAYQSISMGL
jgi:glyoxylase-like metal-dependent hydrolase (beta-lactamase superfamily II)